MDFEHNDPNQDAFAFPDDADNLTIDASETVQSDELDLESILSEDWDSVPDQEEHVMTPEEALNQFLYGEEDDMPAENEEEIEELYPAQEPTQVISVPAESAVEPMEEPEQEEAMIVQDEVYMAEAEEAEVAELEDVQEEEDEEEEEEEG